MDTKSNMGYMITLLVISIIMLIGGAYAYFTAGMSSGETEATLKVGAGQLKIKFANTNSVQIAENVQPTPAKHECAKQTGAYYCNQSEYTPVGTKNFTLTGTNTTTTSTMMPYNIKLIITQNEFSSGTLKYRLYGYGFNGKVVNMDTWQDIPAGANTTGIMLGSGYFMLGENMIHTYSFDIYFPDNHISQDADKNKVFGAKIEITTDEMDMVSPNGWKNASANTLLGAIKRDNSIMEPVTVPGIAVSTSSEKILASDDDDYGTTYYFRGAVENNFVEYANMCWQIVRVTGDGSIKLILYNYNGLTSTNNTPASSTPCNVTGDDLAFARYDGTNYLSHYNDKYNDNAYVGFMYGTPGSSSYDETHVNTNPSTVLTNLNKWYTNVLSKQSGFNESYLADTIWCNDKSVVTNTTFNPLNLTIGNNFGYGDNTNYYRISISLLYLDEEGFTCLYGRNENLSKFTVSDTKYGNGALKGYGKVGLLTGEEITFAGGVAFTDSPTYYLRQNATANMWMGLSPALYLTNGTEDFLPGAYVVGVNNGTLVPYHVNYNGGIRPVIALTSSIAISSGNGTATNPYKVVMN
ncbi:MAG: hypothetical protein MST00_04315 [Tenericutes bacterium]|nr:hypothetical protein [Mycoplasmatota bacterium]